MPRSTEKILGSSARDSKDPRVFLINRFLLAFLIGWTVLLSYASRIAAQESQVIPERFGSFFHFEETPNILFLFDEISDGDSFELRRAIRMNKIDLIVANSPGGAVFEALQISGIIFDNEISTYVPSGSTCVSACSFVFFAGKNRIVSGDLGVHQFYNPNLDAASTASPTDTMVTSQFTASEIIGFLNQYETPAFVYERMFSTSDMYYFNASDLAKIDRGADDPWMQTLIKSAENKLALLRQKLGEQAQTSESQNVTSMPSVSPAAPSVSPNSPQDTSVAKRESIRRLQEQLTRVGCVTGPADGVMGPATKKAIKQFTTQAGLNLEEALSDPSQLERIVKDKPAGYCPKPVRFFADKWAGTYSCNYSEGHVNASLSSQSRNSFSLKLNFSKKNGTVQQPANVMRSSRFFTDGDSLQAQPAAAPDHYASCPDGRVENMRSSCPSRPLEGNERLSGQFESGRKLIKLSGLVHPMGRCSIVISAN